MVLRMKNFKIMSVHWKIWFSGGVHKKGIYRGKCLKMGEFADLNGASRKGGGDVFKGGLVSQCTLCSLPPLSIQPGFFALN